MGSLEKGLDGEMGPSKLSHYLLETVELVRALGWDPESS